MLVSAKDTIIILYSDVLTIFNSLKYLRGNMVVKADLYKIFDNVPVAVHSLDSEGRIAYVNAEWLNLLDRTEDEVLGQCLNVFIHPEFREKALQQFKQFSNKGEVYDLRLALLDSLNNKMQVSIQSFALFKDNDELHSSFAFIKPSLEPQAKCCIKNSNFIDIKSEFVSELLSSLSHHWRQPLNALGLMIQNIAETFINTEKEEDFKEFEKISMSIILEMSQMIENFRQLFQTDKTEVFSVIDVVEKVFKMYSPALLEAKISTTITCNCEKGQSVFTAEYKHDCDGNCTKANGSEINFKQIIIHLISNAVDAIKRAERKNGKLYVTIENFIKQKRVIVTDNGKGIPSDIKDKIFDPYFTTTGISKNKGLGLYLAKTLTEKNMNGIFSYDITKDKTSFAVTID